METLSEIRTQLFASVCGLLMIQILSFGVLRAIFPQSGPSGLASRQIWCNTIEVDDQIRET